MTHKPMKQYILTVVAIIISLGCVSSAFAQMPPSAVRIDLARLENVQEMRRVTGDLRAVARSRVATQEEGLVIELPVTEGDTVKKGDILARLDDCRLKLQLQRNEAQEQVALAILDEREAEVELSKHDYEQLRILQKRGASNPKEIADAVSDLKATEARRDQAQRQLEVIGADSELLRTRISDTSIIAPFDGVVVEKSIEVGEWIGEGDEILQLVAVGAYDAWLDIPQRYATSIIGKDITLAVFIDAVDLLYPPTKPRVIRQVDPIARTFAAIVRIEDKANTLAPGMSVTGWAPTGEYGEHLTIAKDALMKSPTGYFVYVVRSGREGGESAMPATIHIEFDLGDRLAVNSSSIEPGDRIIVEGNERLFPSSPVTISQPSATEMSSR